MNKELKKCLLFFIELGEKIDSLINGNSFTIMKLVMYVILKGNKIMYLVKNVNTAMNQWKDLDELEKGDLKLWFAGEFDIENDDIEKRGEDMFAVLVDLINDDNIGRLAKFFTLFKSK